MRTILGVLVLAAVSACASATSSTSTDVASAPSSGADPRIGLRGGYTNAAMAASNMQLVSNTPRPAGFYDVKALGNILLANSDMAYKGNYLFMGSFNGFQIFDISSASAPKLVAAVLCPGGQGDMSVHGNLLFMSVEMPNGRLDCKEGNMSEGASSARFLGVRIFDISNIASPKQVAAVQTCRGSHTHTLVPDPNDAANVYIYVSGVSTVRPASELAGCADGPANDRNTARFRIEVIQVPVASPQNARIVSSPRIFADAQGNPGGLWAGGAHGAGTQTTAVTDQCHDITVYPEMGIAAGACSGNGIILDIRDIRNPVRVAEVSDPNFAYWHGATLNNDASRVVFSDEWGGGMQARCTASDPRNWGADAIFTIDNRRLTLAGYYKLPVQQSTAENCVAHNGSLIPVPGRDIMVQSWYQGGVSVFDFTDPANPREIAFFDRGPQTPDLQLGGAWSSYWYNGSIYVSEITRGLDILQLKPSEHLSQNEIDAAKLVKFETMNPQTQMKFTWPAKAVVAKAYIDQLQRAGVSVDRLNTMRAELDRADRIADSTARHAALVALADTVAPLGTSPAVTRIGTLLAQTLRSM